MAGSLALGGFCCVLCFIGFSKRFKTFNHNEIFQYYCLNRDYNPSNMQLVFVLTVTWFLKKSALQKHQLIVIRHAKMLRISNNCNVSSLNNDSNHFNIKTLMNWRSQSHQLNVCFNLIFLYSCPRCYWNFLPNFNRMCTEWFFILIPSPWNMSGFSCTVCEKVSN